MHEHARTGPDRPQIRTLRAADAPAAALLHEEVLGAEFVARCGARFLRRYHEAWVDSIGGVALGAFDDRGVLVGVLLGAVDPAAHTAAMVRRHGFAMAVRLMAAAATRPRLARDLAVTRVGRYAHGLWRVVGRPAWQSLARRLGAARRPAPPLRALKEANEARTGEVTHLLVAPSQQNRGTGRALLDTALERARRAGLDEVVLVTLPDDRARGFYERLGWWADGAVSSRSGEAFVRYRYPLRGPPRGARRPR